MLVFARDHGEIDRLGVDAETVMAETDDLGPFFEDLLTVAQAPRRLLARRLQRRLDLVRLDTRARARADRR